VKGSNHVQGKLVLANGAIFEGELFGAVHPAYGEVVFNTSMTGYQEIMTDPSYCGQIIVLTYPMIGNYGVNLEDDESRRSFAAGLVVSEHCSLPSNFRSKKTIAEYLSEQGLCGIAGVDTRALVQTLRQEGTMAGYILPIDHPGALGWVPLPTDQVRRVSTPAAYVEGSGNTGPHVVLYDFGAKTAIAHALVQRGCRVTVVPYTTTAEQVDGLKPDGIVFSNGPGDPTSIPEVIPHIQALCERYPIMGICLGHQLLALAHGAKTTRLPFGHRGANHPVKDLRTGKVYITAQNHGYVVTSDSVPDTLVVTHRHVNDRTVAGFHHVSRPILSVQYHPEACPGPRESAYLFDEFLAMMREPAILS
jgi:carbamoyl-phosphate synthase small subunit